MSSLNTEIIWLLPGCRFYDKWDFPNLVGAVDGKHVHMRAPANSGTEYYNYKKHFSLNLMAVVDADYKFLMVDVGQMGSVSDGGVWDASEFGSGWSRNLINVPPPSALPNTDINLPYLLIGDEAFPLKPNFMRPYPGRDINNNMFKRRYNYRLSRARRVVENAFGILANRWRFLFTPVDAKPENLTSMIYAACILHNMLCSLSDYTYVPPGFADHIVQGNIVEGLWRNDAQHLGEFEALPARNHMVVAANHRDQLSRWFSEEGSRDWQDALITRLG